MFHVTFQPSGKKITVDGGCSVLEAASRAGIPLEANCGGHGTCGKCRVLVVRGKGDKSRESVSEVSASEKKLFSPSEMEQGWRLACEARIIADTVIEIPAGTAVHHQVILEKGKDASTECLPEVEKIILHLEKPTLEDFRDDLTRVKDALLEHGIAIRHTSCEAIRQLPSALREKNYTVTCVVKGGDTILGFLPGEDEKNYGLAVDVGTTTVAVYLCDLNSGKTILSDSFMNPQIPYGDDVISRVSCIREDPEKLSVLHSLLMDRLNETISDMAKSAGIDVMSISEAVLVFNTVMECIALSIDPRSIGVSPFVSPVSSGLDLSADWLGLHILPGGLVHALPSEAGFVGADNVAVLLACEPFPEDKTMLIIDIGTNSEIDLVSGGKIWSTSCATGPALEGAQISCGMRAAEGAIDAVEIDRRTLRPFLHIIGGSAVPEGICGSGILDAVAKMAECGIIRADGRFDTRIDSPYLRRDDAGHMEYVLYRTKTKAGRDITIKADDVRAVQLAKAALYAGASALLDECGAGNPDEIILAGAFGSFIDKVSAKKLGMFPDCPADHIRVVGNAAGTGARIALLNRDASSHAEKLARSVNFIETAARDGFRRRFTDSMYIPHRDDAFTSDKPVRFLCGGIHEPTRPASDFHYMYNSFSELVERGLPDGAVIQKKLEDMNRPERPSDVADIPGPFALLASFLSPEQLYRASRKNGEELTGFLNELTPQIAEYSRKKLADGCRVLSFADPAGEMEICGSRFFGEFSGAADLSLFRALEGDLRSGIMHICGKTSTSMEKAGFMLSEPVRVKDGETYMDILRDLAADRRVRFAGHGCINERYPSEPIVYQLRLRKKEGSDLR